MDTPQLPISNAGYSDSAEGVFTPGTRLGLLKLQPDHGSTRKGFIGSLSACCLWHKFLGPALDWQILDFDGQAGCLGFGAARESSRFVRGPEELLSEKRNRVLLGGHFELPFGLRGESSVRGVQSALCCRVRKWAGHLRELK